MVVALVGDSLRVCGTSSPASQSIKVPTKSVSVSPLPTPLAESKVEVVLAGDTHLHSHGVAPLAAIAEAEVSDFATTVPTEDTQPAVTSPSLKRDSLTELENLLATIPSTPHEPRNSTPVNDALLLEQEAATLGLLGATPLPGGVPLGPDGKEMERPRTSPEQIKKFSRSVDALLG
jgi:hypothetical protein